jgi:hypothetical protein
MHLLIPFAFCSHDGCANALANLRLPHLTKLLARLSPQPPDTADLFSLSTPHERALARALGLPVQDGLIPWAARQAQASGAWGFITPCHWQIATNHITLSGQVLPDFPEAESRALMAAMQPYFEEDGIELRFDSPMRWLAHGDIFQNLPTASLDRVAGRNVEHWMPRSPQAAPLRRLQNEMQMLLYTHPVNDARSARGVLPVNSFWLSGTGALATTPATAPTSPTNAPAVINALREPALAEDWAAWAQAWLTIDATEIATLSTALAHGQSCQLTLCGEQSAQTWVSQPQSFFRKLMNHFGTQPTYSLINKL